MEIPENLIESVIDRGDIILSETSLASHDKFFVVIGVSEDRICGCFFINSNIHKYIVGKQALLDMQYPIKSCDYNFLSYTSFINCANLIEIERSKFAKKLSDGTAKVIGRLKDDDIDSILWACRDSKLFSKMEKDKYFS